MSACARTLARARCATPITTDGRTNPRSYERQIADILRRCPEVPAANLMLDCSAYPCVIALREESKGPLVSCLQKPLPDSVHDLDSGWSIYGLDRTPESHVLLREEIERTAAQRFAGLAWRLDARAEDSDASGCGMPPVPSDCDELLAHLGCEASNADEELDRELTEAHFAAVDRWMEEISTDCAGFHEARWTLDCSEIPCLLAFSKDELDAHDMTQRDALCGSAPYRRILDYGHDGEEMVTLLPLADLVDCPDCSTEDLQVLREDLDARWLDRQAWRAWTLVNDFTGRYQQQ